MKKKKTRIYTDEEIKEFDRLDKPTPEVGKSLKKLGIKKTEKGSLKHKKGQGALGLIDQELRKTFEEGWQSGYRQGREDLREDLDKWISEHPRIDAKTWGIIHNRLFSDEENKR